MFSFLFFCAGCYCGYKFARKWGNFKGAFKNFFKWAKE